MAERKCEKCGSTSFERQDGYDVCRYCGARYPVNEGADPANGGTAAGQKTVNVQINVNAIPGDMISDKNWLLTLLLSIFFGYFGIHRFYAGKLCTGAIWFCTAGCFFVGWLGDIIKIAMGRFTDKDGKYIRRH